MKVENWDNVLVLQTSFLGDTVLTLPLFSEIKLRFPSSKLTVLCGPQAKELLQDHPGIDEIIVDDKKAADRGALGLWRKSKVLRDKSFTMGLTPHKSLRSVPCRTAFEERLHGVVLQQDCQWSPW